MKKWNFVILLFVSLAGYAQEWRESLSVAREAYKQQQYKKAYNYYQRVQKNIPIGIDLYQEIAQAAYKAQDYIMAKEMYDKYIQQVKDSTKQAVGFYNIGNVLMQQGQYSQAIVAYQESIKLNPNNDKTRHNLIEAQKKNKIENNINDYMSQNQAQYNNQTYKQQTDQPSKLEKKKVEKKLDELTKQEMQTKQQMSQSNNRIQSSQTKKDW